MTPLSLGEFIRREIKKMVTGTGTKEPGNIYSLVMEEVERHIIELVLQENQYNYLATAKMLGISRSTLYRRIQHLNLIPK
jgi:DNA-binding protein Fis